MKEQLIEKSPCADAIEGNPRVISEDGEYVTIHVYVKDYLDILLSDIDDHIDRFVHDMMKKHCGIALDGVPQADYWDVFWPIEENCKTAIKEEVMHEIPLNDYWFNFAVRKSNLRYWLDEACDYVWSLVYSWFDTERTFFRYARIACVLDEQLRETGGWERLWARAMDDVGTAEAIKEIA